MKSIYGKDKTMRTGNSAIVNRGKVGGEGTDSFSPLTPMSNTEICKLPFGR